MHGSSCNYYEVLDIPPDANQDAIDDAYKTAKKTFSLSNSNLLNTFTKEEAIDWLNMIDEAYSVIGHPNTRRVYDRKWKNVFSNQSKGLHFLEESKKSKTRKGLADTPISQYKVDKHMEDLITTQEVFDGSFLKKVREYKNIKLTDFSEFTCIALHYLRAIEDNNPSILPAAVFVRGYIIQYCRILGLDESKAVPSFMSQLKNG